jgi:endonuclease/exonuclease/phosphatase family metal-dependent hydrolase
VRLISWNIQWCRGVDGRVDPARIFREARAHDPDVCCFQEVAARFDSLEGSAGEDQFEILGGLFRGFSAHAAVVVDVPDGRGGRRRFGNMILSRLPVRQVFRHSLPWPRDDSVPNMPRVALETVIEAPWGEAVSVTTTHLEFYSTPQRSAQVDRLLELETERQAHARAAPSSQYKSGPFEPLARPSASLLCGDFNMRPDDPLSARLRDTYADAWAAANAGAPQPPTFGVHDSQFTSEPYACDFVFASKALAPRLAAVRVDGLNKSSDHQPVIVELR